MTVQRRSAFLRISLSDLASTRVARRRGAGTACTTEGRIRTGRWAGFPVGVQNYGSTRKASTSKYLSEVSHITGFWGLWASRRRQPGLGKKNRRLRDLPAGHIEAGDICEVHLRSEEHTSELQSPCNLVCRLLLEKKKKQAKHDSLRSDDLSTTP